MRNNRAVVATMVHLGQARCPDDGSRRFLPDAVSFDTRPHLLSIEIENDWDAETQANWRVTKARVSEQIVHQLGVEDYDQKIRNIADLGSAPWSLIALHNTYLKQVRDAFAATSYYPALLGACGLGERILNQLVLTLRDDYTNNPATRYVDKKQSVDDWRKCIRVLREWDVFDDETGREYLSLMNKRNAAVHYRSVLDNGDARQAALDAVVQLCALVERIFTPIGQSPHYFAGPIGRSYVKREAENLPFVRHFILPACVLVSPVYRFVPGGIDGLTVYDDPDYGVGKPPLSDDEYADPARAAVQVAYPF